MFPSETSETKATNGLGLQLSASSITTAISGAGAGPFAKFMSTGFEAVGGVVSSIVMVCVAVATLPQASV